MILAVFKSGDWFSAEHLGTAARVVLIAGLGLPLAKVIALGLGKFVGRKFSGQSAMIVRKLVFYALVLVCMVMVLQELGFHLGTLLGAAGIVGIALGFASQTSVSNIISGVFLISERPFEVGDLIQVGTTVGTVMSVDLLSVKVRAFDNRFIRIPNETMLKTEVVNFTRFPLRRVDLDIGVAYKEDPQRVEDILRDVAAHNPLCLDEPEPVFMFRRFGDSALELMFAVWAVKADFLALRNSIMREIKTRFDEEGIEIPFPHRTLYTGAVTDPMPVKIVESNPSGENAL
jgi:small-conductance mechanosensitive channel